MKRFIYLSKQLILTLVICLVVTSTTPISWESYFPESAISTCKSESDPSPNPDENPLDFEDYK